MAKINFQLVTPERKLLDEEIDSLTCPTTTGQITILPGHEPLISSLAPGEMIVRSSTKPEPEYIAVSGGFVEVRPGSKIVILADTAEHAREIDVSRAEEAHERAIKAMQEADKLSESEYESLLASIRKNAVRLHVAKRYPHRGSHTVSQGILKE